jgi:hypothetical protein
MDARMTAAIYWALRLLSSRRYEHDAGHDCDHPGHRGNEPAIFLRQLDASDFHGVAILRVADPSHREHDGSGDDENDTENSEWTHVSS